MGDGRRLRFPAPDRVGSVEVAGCAIEWSRWDGDDPSLPTPLLIHGARAHRGWWSAVVAELRSRSIGAIALDLSGNGDSGWRQSYSAELWATEAVAVAQRELDRPAVLVGHSMGGQVGLGAAAEHPEAVGALILLDTKIELPTAATGDLPRGVPGRPLRLYPTCEAAVASFRLEPMQPLVNEAFVREVAARSLRREDGGWRWKFDTAIAQRWTDAQIAEFAARVECPLWLIRGEESTRTSLRTSANLEALTGMPVSDVAIPGAYHHLILDQPELVGVAIAETLLSTTKRLVV
jgi:pimeloyl-ACP methyl ester carboxylesterase